VGPEHLFLGLMRVETGAAGKILVESGFRLNAVREQIAREGGHPTQ
jgi:hypothetical protein